MIARCLPRKFNINKLDAAVYYERQPKSDVFLQEIHDRADLYKARSLIIDPHEQPPSKQLSLNKNCSSARKRLIEKYGDNEVVSEKEEIIDTPGRDLLKDDRPSEPIEMAT